jgi:hypothetical protein
VAKAYSLIWERIRANPEKGVPIDIVSAFTKRVIAMVKKEKWADEVYRIWKAGEGKTGLMFVHRAKHPTDNRYVRVTFLLREFSTTNESDSYYLRKFPPNTDLIAQLKLETIPAMEFGAVNVETTHTDTEVQAQTNGVPNHD